MLSSWERINGPVKSLSLVFPVLWCLGLACWSLRAIRSHESRFRLPTILCIVAVVAIGFANRFAAMIVVFLAMTIDFGVTSNNTASRMTFVWRTIQTIAGVTGVSHACRFIYHVQLNSLVGLKDS